MTKRKRRHTQGDGDPARGFEVIPLDPSTVPDVETALSQARERRDQLTAVAKASFGVGGPLFREHLPLLSFVNRAVSLHDGVIAAVTGANPHAAFTLLRAQLELAVLVRYLDRFPDYLAELEKPKPEGKRRTFAELFEDAAAEPSGIRTVYATLSEMAHFGATALWHPFSVDDTDGGAMLSFGTGPDWRFDDEPRVVLGMLSEAEEGLLVFLSRYVVHHISPKVMAIEAREQVRLAIQRAGITDTASMVSPDVAIEAFKAGVIRWCEEHGALEPAEGITPEAIDAWAASRAPRDV